MASEENNELTINEQTAATIELVLACFGGARDNQGRTLLHITAEQGNIDLMKFLIDQNPGLINLQNLKGMAAISYAINAGHTEIVRFLLPKVSKELLNTTYEGMTLLHGALSLGHIEIAKLLIPVMSREAIEAADEVTGFTALHFAAHRGYKEVIELLLPKMSYDAMKSSTKMSDMTAAEMALNGGRIELFKMIVTATVKASPLATDPTEIEATLKGLFEILDRAPINEEKTHEPFEHKGDQNASSHLEEDLTALGGLSSDDE